MWREPTRVGCSDAPRRLLVGFHGDGFAAGTGLPAGTSTVVAHPDLATTRSLFGFLRSVST